MRNVQDNSATLSCLQTIWLDAAEPERSQYNFGDFRFQLGTDTEIGEAWIQQHVRTFADGFAGLNITGADYFVLPRHSWAGAWKYSAALWSGDIQSTFEELALQVTVLQVRGSWCACDICTIAVLRQNIIFQATDGMH